MHSSMKRLPTHSISLDPTPSTELAIGLSESPRARIKRIMSGNPVIIFARPSCCMCTVMKSLLTTVGAAPAVIEVEEGDDSAVARVCGRSGGFVLPALCIGGVWVGGLENMVGLHLNNGLVPRLAEAGALNKKIVM